MFIVVSGLFRKPANKNTFHVKKKKHISFILTVQKTGNAELILQRETYFPWISLSLSHSALWRSRYYDLQPDSSFHFLIGLFLSKKYLHTFLWGILHEGWWKVYALVFYSFFYSITYLRKLHLVPKK